VDIALGLAYRRGAGTTTLTGQNSLVSSFAIEPDVPRDPLAAAESASWATKRAAAVASLPLDPRAKALLDALEGLDELIEAAEHGELTEIEADWDEAAQAEAIDLSPEEVVDAEALEVVDVAEAFVQAGRRDRHQFASADTIVLSGPDIKRKIRHKQSIMPSYVAQVLYEDIGALFEIGDREGALISLERLLTIAPITPSVMAFLDHNEARLLEYYESTLGPWTRPARLKAGAEQGMPAGYFQLEKMATIVALLDGRPVSEVLSASGLRPIEACAVLSQLARSASLDLGAA
jgi:hypothetical protein